MGIIAWIVFGLIAGFIASKIVNQSGGSAARHRARRRRRGRRRVSVQPRRRQRGHWLQHLEPLRGRRGRRRASRRVPRHREPKAFALAPARVAQESRRKRHRHAGRGRARRDDDAGVPPGLFLRGTAPPQWPWNPVPQQASPRPHSPGAHEAPGSCLATSAWRDPPRRAPPPGATRSRRGRRSRAHPAGGPRTVAPSGTGELTSAASSFAPSARSAGAAGTLGDSGASARAHACARAHAPSLSRAPGAVVRQSRPECATSPAPTSGDLKQPAAPIPPPMHIVTTTYFAPRRFPR